ncbi:hypothetical protein FBU31_002417 [Coemansia sp. 'formosensis']|nr:hypothetical protein FBU31_002417 [Coemansia sp. 'formosensis']
MDDETLDHILDTVEHLVCNQRALFARMKEAEQAIQTNSSTGTETSGTTDVEQETSTGHIGVEPILYTRLDEIQQGVCARKSSWASLRELYPPGESAFAPLSFTVSAWTAITGTGLDDNLVADEVYSQAATMAAYGVDLLSNAFCGPVVDRRKAALASNLMAVLCATLTDTRDKRRNVVFKMVNERMDALQNDHGAEENLEAESSRMLEQNKDGETCTGDSARLRRPITRQQGRRAEGSGAAERSHPYAHDGSGVQRQQQQRRGKRVASRGPAITQNKSPEAVALPANGTTNSNCANVDGTASSVLKTTANLTLSQRWPLGLERQDIIRAALSRQGRSESAIAAHINRFGKGTNRAYDSVWRYWASWCSKRSLDPAKRSDADLEKLTLECNRSMSWKGKLRAATRSVWAAADHTPHGI